MNGKDIIHLFVLLFLDIISLYPHSKETRVPYLDLMHWFMFWNLKGFLRFI